MPYNGLRLPEGRVFSTKFPSKNYTCGLQKYVYEARNAAFWVGAVMARFSIQFVQLG
jgi:hypothetical protein